MTDKLHVFEGNGIRVTWSKARCIHSAECVRGLPLVFQPGSHPWVKPDRATAEKIAEIIERCPTGALHYERLDGGRAESATTTNTVTPEPDGPLMVRGQIEILDAEGNLLHRDTRVALCRCGGSSNKPFCDGSHRARGFSDPGEVFAGSVKPGEDPGSVLRFTVRPAGPLKARGTLVVRSADGLVRVSGGDAAFCRCGGTRNRPFCDKSHERLEFEQDSSTSS
ncbi:MAG TPA: CDGSH iron-sulfur domain-containing protein [Candidatus Eisenbacteria bacterium]|nr:CDGSH iron-sulfur domain-containing protein [Candidatus Eisenbacteria bacterium]